MGWLAREELRDDLLDYLKVILTADEWHTELLRLYLSFYSVRAQKHKPRGIPPHTEPSAVPNQRSGPLCIPPARNYVSPISQKLAVHPSWREVAGQCRVRALGEAARLRV